MNEQPRQPWVYFDGNAITALWDWHTKVTQQAKTGEPRDQSPFSDVVLSDFSLDELITIPIGNAYKKHLLMFTIFPDIPVMLPLEKADLQAAEQDRTRLLRDSQFLLSVASLRARALLGDSVALDGLNQDIAKKTKRVDADAEAARSRKYVPKGQRIDLSDAVELAVEESGLHPEASSSDFFNLCRRLYEFEIARLINRPATARKGASRDLNQQFDYYHLSYLPFVDGFVTDDRVLRDTARTLCERFRSSVQVHSVDEYHRSWLREQLTGQ